MNSENHDSPDALESGVILRDYVIRQPIGQGGFAITYLAHDTVFDRPVAIKEFLPTDVARRFGDSRVGPRSTRFSEDYESGLGEFLREAKMLDRLDHPNVVRVRAFFRENGTAYLVMEYVDGPTLAAWLATHGSVSAEELAALLRALVEGLRHIHARECLHRDIKPDNIILRSGRIDQPVLVDFGAAREAVIQRSRSVAAIVSAGYTPLEQYGSNRTLSPSTDLYALCAVAYRCITGNDPPAATDRAIIDSIQSLMNTDGGRYPAALLSALDAGLALRIADRPATFDALTAALQSPAAESPPPPVAPLTAVTPAAARAAARDRQQRTIKADFLVEEKETASAPSAAAAVSPPPDAYPKPIFVCLLALIIGTAGALRLGHDDDFRKQQLFINLLILQAVLAFPIAAYIGTYAVHRFFGRAKPGAGRIALTFVLAYVGLSIPGSYSLGFLMSIAGLAEFKGLEIGKLLLTGPMWYWSMAKIAPFEFLVFGASMFLLYALGRRIRWSSGPHRQRLRARASILPALLASSFVFGNMAFFASVRQDHLDKEAPKELYRTGHALDDSPESKSKAIRAIQASLGAESTGTMTRQVLDWLKAQPTKTSYIVAQDGSGDFTTIAAANQHIDSVMGGLEEPDRKEAAFLIEVRPGLYREQVTLSRSRVELRGTMGEKRSVIEAPDDGTAITITADDVTLGSLTIKSATKTAATVNVTASSARIVGNWIFGGTEDYCGLNVGGSVKRERFDLPYDAVRGEDTLSGFAARNGVPSTGELEKLNPNVVWFREKVLRTAAFPWELDKPSPPRVMVHGNTFSGGCGVLTFEKGAPDIGSNTFLVSRHAIVARGESTPVIFPNNYTSAGGNAVLAVDSSEVRITGKQWRGALKNAALIAADDQAVVWLAPSALMSPDPCLSLTGTSSAKVTRTSFRCSTPILATSQTQLNIGDSRFEYNPYRGVDPWNYINRGSGAKVEVNETEVENAPPLTGTFSTTST